MDDDLITPETEYFGGAINLGNATTTRLPHPSGWGGARLIYCEPDGAGMELVTPVVRFTLHGEVLQAGGRPCYVVVNNGTGPVNLFNSNLQSLFTIPAGQVARLFLIRSELDQPEGSWAWTFKNTVVSQSTAQRQFYSIRMTASTSTPVNVLDQTKRLGYNLLQPAFVLVSLVSATIGSNDSTVPAIDTDVFPTGSAVFFEIDENSHIIGRGGNGGRGRTPTPGLLSSPGDDGGAALRLRTNSTILSYGSIRGGGGGGGGGGGSTSSVGAGGGGGGAGFANSLGGQGGGSGGNSGGSGTLAPGAGGTSPVGNGGNGGTFGGSGQAGVSGSPGGAGGAAIEFTVGTNVQFLNAGSIQGGQVTI